MTPAPERSLPPALPLGLLQRLCTSREMRRWDEQAIAGLGLPGRLLMENAAGAVVNVLLPLIGAGRGPVAVCCGSGNNGGDGYAVARQLANRGLEVVAISLRPPAGGDALANLEAWSHFGRTIDFAAGAGEAASLLNGAAVVVDALFGTGLDRPIEGAAETLIALVNDSPAPIKVGVDVPSGVNADTGAVLGCAVRCSHTVSFQVGKVGCHQFPGAGYAGAVSVAPVSIPVHWQPDDPASYLLERPFLHALLPPRPADGHKGTFGNLLALCGSAGMGGAAQMAGSAALKAGTGIVTMGVPASLRDAFLRDSPELLTLVSETGGDEGFGEEEAGFFLEAATTRTAAVLGCGLGRRKGTRAFVRKIAAEMPLPLLIDADGLNLLEPGALTARSGPTVITPHPGEMVRLSGLAAEELAADRVGHARRLAADWGVVLVLKGAASVVAAPGGEAFINTTGDQGLASAGTGDVLSGLIGGLLAQRVPPLAAALLGVYWHGLARDCRREEISAASFTAQDLIAAINDARLALEQG